MNQELFRQKRIGSTLRAAVFPLLLIFTLLGSQAVSLQHHHEDSVAHHLDCSICAKKTTDTDFLITVATLQVDVVTGSVFNNPVFTVHSNAPLSAKSRSPPLS